jgi:hypothetical protein
MQTTVRTLASSQFDDKNNLRFENHAKQLSGIAFAHEDPTTASLRDLLDVIVDTRTKPFNQYWAVRALRIALSYQEGAEVTQQDLERLSI